MRKRTYFRVCPDCGSHLDAGEICECRRKGAREHDRHEDMLGKIQGTLHDKDLQGGQVNAR